MGPLSGIRVLDLSTLLPGPLATHVLARAGADVVKIEQPPSGDPMRAFAPVVEGCGAGYLGVNRTKRVYAADLKDPADHSRVLELAAGADVLVEQFRPGVATRLGVGYDAVRAVNPGIIYCSITGYGQHGPDSGKAGHDLNYLAEAGVLGLVVDREGVPAMPAAAFADVAGGAYPAVINILLALRLRDLTGAGQHLDVGITPNLAPLVSSHVAAHQSSGRWPSPSRELFTGGSPRYRVYEAADGRHLAVGALEDRFWHIFTTLVGLPVELRVADADPDEVGAEIARIVGTRSAASWAEVFTGHDVCVSIVWTLEEATGSTSPGCEAGGAPTPVDPGLLIPVGQTPLPHLTPVPDGPCWL